MEAIRIRSWLLLVVGFLAGCGAAPTGSAGTDAQDAVQGYYEALLRRDWARAYAALHPDSRKRYSSEQFTRLAQKYCRQLGFEPKSVRVRACEEHGAEAVAHIVFTGSAGAAHYKEAVVLRQSEAGWAVVLPPHFAQTRSR